MKLNRWLKYIIALLVIAAYLMLFPLLLNLLSERMTAQANTNMTYGSYFVLFILANVLCYFVLGGLVGGVKLWDEFEKEGKWKFNTQKLIIFGVPLLLVICILIFSIIVLAMAKDTTSGIYTLANSLSNFLTNINLTSFQVFLILLGIVVPVCFYKEAVITEEDAAELIEEAIEETIEEAREDEEAADVESPATLDEYTDDENDAD